MSKTPEQRLTYNRERYYKPGVRERVLARQKERRKIPEVLERIHKYHKNYYADPENRAWKRTQAKERYAADPGAWKQRNRQWYLKNRERIAERRRMKWANDPAWRKEQLEKQERWKRANLEKHRACQRRMWLKRVYGITPEEYDRFLAQADSKCAICGSESNLNLDHCHSSNKIRGILCNRCNQGIGYFLDDSKLLKQAILYLETHRA